MELLFGTTILVFGKFYGGRLQVSVCVPWLQIGMVIDLIVPLETPWKRLRGHDGVKVCERLAIGYTDWLSDLC